MSFLVLGTVLSWTNTFGVANAAIEIWRTLPNERVVQVLALFVDANLAETTFVLDRFLSTLAYAPIQIVADEKILISNRGRFWNALSLLFVQFGDDANIAHIAHRISTLASPSLASAQEYLFHVS